MIRFLVKIWSQRGWKLSDLDTLHTFRVKTCYPVASAIPKPTKWQPAGHSTLTHSQPAGTQNAEIEHSHLYTWTHQNINVQLPALLSGKYTQGC